MNSLTKTIKVKDKEDVQISIINYVSIKIINLALDQYVDVNAIISHDDDYIRSYNFRIQGEEYKNWGSSDTYLENLILSKLGLERA